MKRYKLHISYDGTPFGGWQIQPNAPTIQGTLHDTFQTLLEEKVHISGSGRTDAGVHAKEQVAHFSTATPLPNDFLEEVNHNLPSEICLLKLEEVSPDFHARFSVKQKTYHYHIANCPVLSPFERRYRTHLYYDFDYDKLKKALTHFMGTHDFSTFANERGAPCSPVKTLTSLDFVDEGEGRFRLEFSGNGFLYKMVRNIVGTVVWIARGKIALESLPTLFEAKNRQLIPPPAPPQGLFLHSVKY